MKNTSEIIIKCAECGLFLTSKLQELPADFVCNLGDEEDYIPKGFYKKNNGIDWKIPKGKIIINKNDLVNSINHTDYKRLSGCCGLDGFGVNKMCANGHEVATEFSDCWMCHAVIFETDKIEVITL